MSRESIVKHRIGLWVPLLQAYGWEVDTLAAAGPHGRFEIQARRQYSSTPLSATITEVWFHGRRDPDRLFSSEQGCYLHSLTWHAQFGVSGHAEDALRYDVSRKKPPELMVHEHPIGKKNDVRERLPRLGTPEDWLVRVEEFLAQSTP